jgi:hypothetical protein
MANMDAEERRGIGCKGSLITTRKTTAGSSQHWSGGQTAATLVASADQDCWCWQRLITSGTQGRRPVAASEGQTMLVRRTNGGDGIGVQSRKWWHYFFPYWCVHSRTWDIISFHFWLSVIGVCKQRTPWHYFFALFLAPIVCLNGLDAPVGWSRPS